MFELEKTIDQYKNELLSNPSLNEDAVNELLSHLGDEMDTLKMKGLSEEESFWIARHRMGNTDAIHQEFSKINRSLVWQKRLIWFFLGYLILSLGPTLMKFAAMPFIIWDLRWASVKVPFFGQDFSLPFLPYLFILFITGSLLSSVFNPDNSLFQRVGTNKSLFMKGSRYKFVFWIILGFILIKGTDYLTSLFMVGHIDKNTLVNLQFSQSLFSFLWPWFLIGICVVLSFIYRQREPKVVA